MYPKFTKRLFGLCYLCVKIVKKFYFCLVYGLFHNQLRYKLYGNFSKKRIWVLHILLTIIHDHNYSRYQQAQ
jgi:uncharacterized membrane protein